MRAGVRGAGTVRAVEAVDPSAAVERPRRPPGAATSIPDAPFVEERDAGSSLRVLLVTTDAWLGGAEVQVATLARALMRRGHEVLWASLQDPANIYPQAPREGIPFEHLGMRRGRPDPRGALRLAALVRRFRPDVVHSHMVHANLLARAARVIARVPVQISTAHSIWEGPRWREVAYRLTDPLCTLTTNVSQAGVDRYVRVGAAPDEKIRHHPNGLDVDAYAPDEDARARTRAELGVNGAFLWLAAGSLLPPKDYPNMLEAAARLAERRPGFVLAVAGEGPQRASLLETRAALGLDDGTVRFLGSRDDLPDLMRAADGFVMSSAYEGLPMVLLEASAAALPIVTTDVGGNKEVVRAGETGLVVSPGDPEELATGMRRVMTMPAARRRAWGEAAREEVVRRYGVERVVDRWLALYRELLPRQAGERASRRRDGPQAPAA